MKIKTKNLNEFKRLNDIIPELDTVLIRKYLYDNMSGRMQLLLLNILEQDNVESVFIQYIAKSGIKTLSSLVKTFISQEDIELYKDYYILSTDSIITLNKIIDSRYYNKWNKLYNTLKLDYNPIKPYDITTNEDSTESMTTSANISKKSSSEYNDDEDVSSNGTNDYNRYGFNSNHAVPTDVNNNENNSKTTTMGTNSNEMDTESTYEREKPFHREVSRVGNIGNITQQELIEKEREIAKYQIIDIIFQDLDAVLTRSKYL